MVLSCPGAGTTVSSESGELLLIKERLINDALKDFGFFPRIERYFVSDFSKAAEYLETQKQDGSWSDIDYETTDNNFPILVHLDRILVMAYNYSEEASGFYHNTELLSGITRALQYWYEVNLVCKNWYKNKIAKQHYFHVIAILMQGKISDTLINKVIEDLIPAPYKTGSNRVLLSMSVFYRGVLENNVIRMREGIEGVTGEIRVSSENGIQQDNSFHHHGAFLYNGNYGHDYLRETSWLGAMLAGTSFAFPDDKIKILRDYYLEGTRWMIRGGLVDHNVRGRTVGRPDGFIQYGNRVIPQMDYLMRLDPEYKDSYRISQEHLRNFTPQDISGNRHFWRSDYTVHHRPDYFTSVKMCSERTVGTEGPVNSDNQIGYWLPYGLTYIVQRGNEFESIFPSWDWGRLPGVTSPHIEIKTEGQSSQSTTFVGGLSDGMYGISTMHLSIKETEAKKSWFWFDKEWLALGANISSTYDAPIVTGINQTLLNGPLWTDGESLPAPGRQSLENPKWIWHDNVAYVFPEDDKIEFKAGPQSGHLQRVYGLGEDTVYTNDIFSLWFEHGKNPLDESYAYIVVPGIGTEKLQTYTDNMPVEILSNTATIQSVRHKKLYITGIVFHKAGAFSISNNISITVDSPSLILINGITGVVSVCDPAQELSSLNITVKDDLLGKTSSRRVTLPTDQYAGTSIKLEGMIRKMEPD